MKHLANITLDASKIIEYENGWMCPSFSSSEMYLIQRNTQQICDKRECYLKCVTCNNSFLSLYLHRQRCYVEYTPIMFIVKKCALLTGIFFLIIQMIQLNRKLQYYLK
jgi:hypothetical protein